MSMQERQRVVELELRVTRLEAIVSRLQQRLDTDTAFSTTQAPHIPSINGTRETMTSIGQAVRGVLGRK
jgi:hypothetical protein